MAVEMAKAKGSVSATARELDIDPQMLRRWRKQIGQINDRVANERYRLPSEKTAEQLEIQQLRKQLREAELERDGAAPRILKEAVSQRGPAFSPRKIPNVSADPQPKGAVWG